MLPEYLDRFSKNDHFFFSPDQSLEEVCNAPKKASGVYLICALAFDTVELIYIGSSGKIKNDGQFKHGKGGLFDRLVNGKQFGDRRKLSWPEVMIKHQIEARDIYWFDTFNDDIKEIPAYVEALLIQDFYDYFDRLPRWNEEY